jgi:hypothetical protein
MIAKSGNVLWVPRPLGRVAGAMIMAFDNAKGSKKNCISCCASVNDNFSHYYSQFSTYANNEEKFCEMVKLSFEIITYYSKRNQRMPKEVLIFHNSCAGDQVTLFTNYFLNTLTNKLKDAFGSDMVPNISLIMVNTKTS